MPLIDEACNSLDEVAGGKLFVVTNVVADGILSQNVSNCTETPRCRRFQ